ncbi:MAG: Hint domain-containing protein [Pseudomonadota bacterium]|nr:Hint domain-containing protein [Pseudomonadota bacterium]
MSFSLTSAAQLAATNAGVTLSFNSTTGNITFAYTSGTGHTSAPTDTVWNSIIDGLQYTNTADEPLGTTHAITLVSSTTASGSTYNTTTVNNTETLNVTCFYPGTLIRTPDGEAAVETLKPGDLVLTAAGEAKPVNWLGRQTVSTIFADKMRVLPIRFKAGALGDNLPARDLLVSPDHAMLVEGVLIQAGALVNETSITRETKVPTVFTYYHIELDDHSLILAEGAAAETFVDNVDRLGFDNWSEFEALYPEGKTVEELPYPRAKSHRQVPVNLRVMLAERALRIGARDAAQVA